MSVVSMTGYGNASTEVGGVRIDVETRSVNNRFIDVSCKIPPAYSSLEKDIVAAVKELCARGRVDIFVSRTVADGARGQVVFNRELFEQYLGSANEAILNLNLDEKSARSMIVSNLLSKREILGAQSEDEVSEDEAGSLLLTVTKALKGLVEMREVEGEALGKDLSQQIDSLEKQVSVIESQSKESVEYLRTRVKERLDKVNLPEEIEEQRIVQEIAILADKTDISEELTRLGSHIAQFRDILKNNPKGKKLEFLGQELGREINTCGSKSQSAEVAHAVVESKAILEKIREQVQNIE